MKYFEDLDKIGYQSYLSKNKFYLDLKENFPENFNKLIKSTYDDVHIDNKIPFQSEYDDLVR